MEPDHLLQLSEAMEENMEEPQLEKHDGRNMKHSCSFFVPERSRNEKKVSAEE